MNRLINTMAGPDYYGHRNTIGKVFSKRESPNAGATTNATHK